MKARAPQEVWTRTALGRQCSRRCWVSAVSLLLGMQLASAQVPRANVPGGIIPLAPERRSLEEQGIAPGPVPDIDLPAVEAPGEGEELHGTLRLSLREVRIRDSTVLTSEAVRALLAPYATADGFVLSMKELEDVRRQLTEIYAREGFLTSGVLLPDQSLAGGVLQLQAVEDRLSEDWQLDGLDRLSASYLTARVQAGVSTAPLDVVALRENLQLLLSDPMVAEVHASLDSNRRPGESHLTLRVVEAPAFSLEAYFDNHRPPSVGSWQAGLRGNFRGIAGFGELVGFDHSQSRGLSASDLYLDVPLSARGTRFLVGYKRSRSRVVEAPFDVIDIRSRSEGYQLGISHPLLRKPGRELRLGAAFERRSATTFLLGRPFSFAPGAHQGETAVSALRLSQSFLDRTREHVLALRSTFSIGLDAFGATINPRPRPDGRFLAWLGQAQYARRLGAGGAQLILRADAQLTPDPLLPMEKFGVGGRYSVRGYRENQLVRDNGWSASAELRLPVGRLAIPGISRSARDGRIELAPFLDYARAWERGMVTADPDHIASIGVGLRWQPSDGVFTSLYLARALHNVTGSVDPSYQEQGIHFELRINAY